MTLPASTFHVVDEVLEECARQDAKWGEQNHMAPEWLAILAEEFGEVAKEVVGITFAHPWSENYRVELVQTAAVAVRIVESYDRQVIAEDTRLARKQMVERPRDLTDRQIGLLASHNSILPRAESKGQIPTRLISLFAIDTPEATAQFTERYLNDPWFHAAVCIIEIMSDQKRDDPDGFYETLSAQQRKAGR